ncbi:569_t:CDS:2, partial [Rhizophagus irregularis]
KCINYAICEQHNNGFNFGNTFYFTGGHVFFGNSDIYDNIGNVSELNMNPIPEEIEVFKDETFILSKITRKSIQTDMLESDLMNTDFTIYLLHPKKSDTKFFKKYVSNQLEMCTISVKSGMELEIVKLGGLGLYKFNRETTTEGCGLVKSAGKEDFVELNSSLTL